MFFFFVEGSCHKVFACLLGAVDVLGPIDVVPFSGSRGRGKVAFEDFLLWVWQCIFMEEILGWNGLEFI